MIFIYLTERRAAIDGPIKFGKNEIVAGLDQRKTDRDTGGVEGGRTEDLFDGIRVITFVPTLRAGDLSQRQAIISNQVAVTNSNFNCCWHD